MKVVRLDNLTTNLRHTRVKCPAVSQSEDPSAFTHPSQHFPLRHVSGRQGRNTSRLLQQDIAGVTSSSGISACASPDTTVEKGITAGFFSATFGGATSCFDSSGDRSRCIWFRFGSWHLECDTTAIVRPRPSSSIRRELKARTLTFFLSEMKVKRVNALIGTTVYDRDFRPMGK